MDREESFGLIGTVISAFVIGFFLTLTLFQVAPAGIAAPEKVFANRDYTLPEEILKMFPLDGYVEIKIGVEPEKVTMISECYKLTADTTIGQTFSIDTGMKNVTLYRPTTHDMIRDVFDLNGIRPVQGRIDSFENGVYYGTLVVESRERIISLDVRPSDMIGVAVRYGMPIYMKESILLEHGEYTCEEE